jgi:hypothetical protein
MTMWTRYSTRVGHQLAERSAIESRDASVFEASSAVCELFDAPADALGALIKLL